jgi:hypothetical protein
VNAGRILREAGYDTEALRSQIAPVDPDRVNIWPASLLLRSMWRKGIQGQTHGRLVFVDPDVLHADPERLARLVIHELVHVRQYKTLGYLRFTYSYLREYVSGRLRGKTSRQAYLDISHEREARVVTAQVSSLTR